MGMRLLLRALPLALLAACSSPVDVELGDTVTLAPGASARLAGYDLQLTFLSVPQDSRCPVNDFVVCAWEGDATVMLRVEGAAGPADVELHTHTDFGRVATYAGFQFTLEDLTPIPSAAGPPPAATYRLRLTVATTTD